MTARGNGTTLTTLTQLAKIGAAELRPVKFAVERGETRLTFEVSCWIAALVVQEQMERSGWKVTRL